MDRSLVSAVTGTSSKWLLERGQRTCRCVCRSRSAITAQKGTARQSTSMVAGLTNAGSGRITLPVCWAIAASKWSGSRRPSTVTSEACVASAASRRSSRCRSSSSESRAAGDSTTDGSGSSGRTSGPSDSISRTAVWRSCNAGDANCSMSRATLSIDGDSPAARSPTSRANPRGGIISDSFGPEEDTAYPERYLRIVSRRAVRGDCASRMIATAASPNQRIVKMRRSCRSAKVYAFVREYEVQFNSCKGCKVRADHA